jgi:phosphoribosylamine-glycine ligase
MKVFVMDTGGDGNGLDIAIRAQDAGHMVKYWLPPTKAGDQRPFGNGMVDKPKEWKPQMDWADLIILTGNSDYTLELNEYFGKGYPIFGANAKSAELELDRGVGQEVLKRYGIKTLPYQVVSSVEEAIKLIVKTKKAYAMKPWGGTANKAMTFVANTPSEAVFILEKWKKDGLFKGELMLQEKVKGIEMGVSGMFGPGGWSSVIEECFEHKKFMNDDLGQNTGEMGTVLRHTTKSKLFDMVLEPITDYLHMVNYVGPCDVNCMIDDKGNPWPFEFTMRLGWPDFCIRQEVFKGDPVQWIADLIEGRDTLRASTDIAVGVIMAHEDFPLDIKPWGTGEGFPIYGMNPSDMEHIHFQEVMVGQAPMIVEGKVERVTTPMTAGPYVLIAGGHGNTVKKAIDNAYDIAWKIKWPSNVMFRTDIGKRLEDQLPELQSYGFATGIKYG